MRTTAFCDIEADDPIEGYVSRIEGGESPYAAIHLDRGDVILMTPEMPEALDILERLQTIVGELIAKLKET